MKTIEEIKKILQDHKNSLEDTYGVVEIGLFGSYTKGIQKQTSDVDILVEFQKAIDLITFCHLKNPVGKPRFSVRPSWLPQYLRPYENRPWRPLTGSSPSAALEVITENIITISRIPSVARLILVVRFFIISFLCVE